MTTASTSLSIPIKERAPEDIRRALKDQDDRVVQTALKLHAYACDNNLGLSQLASQTRIASGILSPWFNGTYTGDCFAICDRVDQFFWRLEQKAKYGGIRQYAETRLARSMCAHFEKTRITRRILLMQSPEQLGKTRVSVEYTERNNSGRTHYVSLSGGSKQGSGDFVWNLAEVCGVPYSIKLREKKIRIRQALEACDLIIIDEAHIMWTWTEQSIMEFLDYLRTDIHANGARGVVLIATNSDMLAGLMRFKQRARYNIGQFLGRMRNQVLQIDPVDDIVEEDVKLLVGRYDYKPGAVALRKLHEFCQREQCGHFGLLDDIMNEAWTKARARKRELDDTLVLDVAKSIMDERAQAQKAVA